MNGFGIGSNTGLAEEAYYSPFAEMQLRKCNVEKIVMIRLKYAFEVAEQQIFHFKWKKRRCSLVVLITWMNEKCDKIS